MQLASMNRGVQRTGTNGTSAPTARDAWAVLRCGAAPARAL